MFDVGWSEMLVIAVVTIIVVGPKELPKMLRTFGKTMSTVRRTANDFKRQFDEALREAERDADMSDVQKSVQSIGNPLADIRKQLADPLSSKPATAPVMSAAPEPPPAAAHEAAPLKTGPVAEAAPPAEVPAPLSGSNAA